MPSFVEDLYWLTNRPIAHRGLHNKQNNIWENSRSAILAAVEHGFAIEFDLQLSKDKHAMVFHDFELERMTGQAGNFRERTVAELKAISLMDGDDKIWEFTELLELVNGRVPLVAELKGKAGADKGFVNSVCDALKSYQGSIAIMSFAHHLVKELKQLLPDRPIGLTAEGDESSYEIHHSFANSIELDFISYEHTQLSTRFVQEFKKTGKPVICWTVKSEEQANEAYKWADQITFEGFDPEPKSY